MTTTTRVAVSQILRNKDDAADDEDEPKKKSREDWRKAKELEEARKAGTAPAAVDETGKDINPHIPQYISSAPWYYGTSGPTLKHQRPQEDREGDFTRLDTYYNKGVDVTKVATKYRKGACENCGAMTHKKKDCLDRPRKIGAKFTSAGIAPDEFNQPNLNLSYDGKRDRWNGYHPSQHKAIIEEYRKVEDAKRELRAKKLEQDPTATEEDEDLEGEDEDKYVDEVDMPGTKVDSKQRITVRNLRIREDTAKYLRNLDPNSAYYDPKTRAMRDNPDPEAAESEYCGENFVRLSGDTRAHAAAQLFAWEAQARGLDVHLLAEPTKLQLLQREYSTKRDHFKSEVKQAVLDKYGGEEHLKAPPRELLLAQSEVFTTYNRDGTLKNPAEKQLAKSKYEEDVLINNHKTVWGSYWKDGQWGYKCCHSFIKMSYCVGEAGKSAVTEVPETSQTHTEKRVEAVNEDKEKSEKSDKSSSEDSSSSLSDSDTDTRTKTEKASKKKKNKKKSKKKKKKALKKEKKLEDKLKKALEMEERSQKRAEYLLSVDERKRPYNSMTQVKEPTTEEMEAFMMKRKRDEDPMSQFM